MPILLHVDELKPGLCLASAVYNGDQRLISGGQKLEAWHIDALRRRFPEMMVRVLDPILDEMAEFDDDSGNTEVSATVTGRMSRLMSSVQGKIGSQTALDGSDLSGLQNAIHEVVTYLQGHPITAAVLLHTNGKTSYLQEHAANVMYLSLLVGNAIRDYVYHERARASHSRTLAVRFGVNLTPLALGCLFHDVGMLELEDLLSKSRPLTDAEQEQVRQHPIRGVEMLPAETDALCKMVVRTHHENACGTGYPLGLPGEKQHIFSRIIRVADAFDAGTSSRVYRDAQLPVRVLWEISAGSHRQAYDPCVSRILAGMVQPFPIGARIRLNCGRYGVVVRHNRKAPFRPAIIIAFDQDGTRIKKKLIEPVIHLTQREDVRLVEFSGQDLSFLNTGPAELPDIEMPDWDRELVESETTQPANSKSFFSFVYP